MRKSLRILCSFLLALLFIVPVANAQTPPGDSSLSETLEQEAQNIDRMLMCPICPAETIDQAQVEISFQMRAVVREMLAEGRTREEILDYFADRYGPDILAAPPKSGVNLLAWILPIVGVAAGLGGVFLVIRAMTGRGNVPSPSGRSPSAPLNAGTGRGGSPSPVAAAMAESATAPPEGDPELAPYLEIADRLLASRRGMRPAFEERPHPPTPASPPEGGSYASGEGISTTETGANG